MRSKKTVKPLIIIVSNEDSISYVKREKAKDIITEVLYALLQLIPQGYVTTYKELSSILGISPRYVGKLLSLNKSPIVIPCHRVVRSNGDVGGYTINEKINIEFKIKLLTLEGVKVKGNRIAKDRIVSLRRLIR